MSFAILLCCALFSPYLRVLYFLHRESLGYLVELCLSFRINQFSLYFSRCERLLYQTTHVIHCDSNQRYNVQVSLSLSLISTPFLWQISCRQRRADYMLNKVIKEKANQKKAILLSKSNCMPKFIKLLHSIIGLVLKKITQIQNHPLSKYVCKMFVTC